MQDLKPKDFQKLRRLIYDRSGINLNAEKQTMVLIRIKPRVRALNLSSTAEYCDYVLRERGDQAELVHLIDAITTNKTDFFREPDHFHFMTKSGLPDLDRMLGKARKARVWSAGCSTGEEPYTLAMVLAEYARIRPGFHFEVLASDICTKVLDKARKAIFKAEVLTPVPDALQRRYFMRSRDRNSDLMRVVPELRSLVQFEHVNFMDAELGMPKSLEMVFCRNVIIYFDRETQQRVLQKLVSHLMPGGYFFSGHSESLQGMELPLEPVASSVYRKLG